MIKMLLSITFKCASISRQIQFQLLYLTSIDILVLVANQILANFASSGFPDKPRQRIQTKIENSCYFSTLADALKMDSRLPDSTL